MTLLFSKYNLQKKKVDKSQPRFLLKKTLSNILPKCTKIKAYVLLSNKFYVEKKKLIIKQRQISSKNKKYKKDKTIISKFCASGKRKAAVACATILLERKLHTSKQISTKLNISKIKIKINNNVLLPKEHILITPFKLLNIVGNSANIYVHVKGGGKASQFDATSLAICKALCQINKKFQNILKKNLFLRIDSRIKERRKYGLKKARKASQYSKR